MRDIRRRWPLTLLKSGLGGEAGVTALEYAFIAGLISLAIVAGVTLIGSWVNDRFTFFADLF